MKIKYSYHEDLLKRLKNPKYAMGYLNEAFRDADRRVFLLALRDVVGAYGGMSHFSRQTKIPRISLYRMLSEKGNPEIKNVDTMLKPMGLCLVVAPLHRSDASHLRQAA